MTADSLQGLRVLITRPEDSALEFAEVIREAGGTPVVFPAIAIVPRDKKAIQADLAAFSASASPLFLFVSGPAVIHGLQSVTELFGDAGILETAAVGAQTASLLKEAGCRQVVVPASGNGSEALLEALQQVEVDGRSVIILRGDSGREKLAQALRSRGASVAMVSVYARIRPQADASVVERKLVDGEIDVVTATSAGIFESLQAMLGEEARKRLHVTPLLVPSERVVTMVRGHGAEGAAIRAEGADNAAMLAALLKWKADESAGNGTGDAIMSEDNRPETSLSESEPGGEEKVEGSAGKASKPQPDTSAQDAHGDKSQDKAYKKPFAEAKKAGAEQKQKSGSGLAGLAFLVALAALAASGWLWWQDKQVADTEQVLAQDLSRSAEQLRASLRSELEGLRRDIASLDDQFADLLIDQKNAELELDGIENLNGRLQALTAEIEGMRGVSNSAKRSWAVAEAAYFLQAANTSLQLGRNVNAAINALAAADDRLASLGEPGLLPVRQAIAAELQALRALPDTDVAGIALALGNLAARADELATRTDKPASYSESGQAQADSGDDQGLARAKRVLGDAMKSMITVRRTDQQATALLAPEEEYFLGRNLELQLLTARLALLKEEPELFAQSLDTSLAWLREFFDLEDPAVAATVEALEGMRSTAVRRSLPDISTSLTLLRGMQDGRE